MDGACLGGGDRMWNEMHTLQQFRCGFFWEGLLLTLIFQRPKCYKNPHDTKKPCIIAEDFFYGTLRFYFQLEEPAVICL